MSSRGASPRGEAGEGAAARQCVGGAPGGGAPDPSLLVSDKRLKRRAGGVHTTLNATRRPVLRRCGLPWAGRGGGGRRAPGAGVKRAATWAGAGGPGAGRGPPFPGRG